MYDLRVVAANLLVLFNNYLKIDHQWSNKLFIELFIMQFRRLMQLYAQLMFI